MYKKLIKMFLITLGAALIVVQGVLSQSVVSIKGDVVTDGFGRAIKETPILVKNFIADDFMWTGLHWFLVDVFIYWLALALIYISFKKI